MPIRVIPRLDIKGPNLVKGVQLEGLRVLGRPEDFARHYYERGADELLYMDVVASLYERNSLTEIIAATSREVFITLTVGGGLRGLADISAVLDAGADKAAINTAALRRPSFITEAAGRFGTSTIVVSIEAKRQAGGSWQAYTDNGRVPSGRDAVEWACEAVDRGAGEILLTSVDREGTGDGFDIELVRNVARRVGVPVVACGGAGRVEHVLAVVVEGRADAVAVASLLHYDAAGEFTPQTGKGASVSFARITPASLPRLKRYLTDHGVACRYQPCDDPVEREPAAAHCGH